MQRLTTLILRRVNSWLSTCSGGPLIPNDLLSPQRRVRGRNGPARSSCERCDSRKSSRSPQEGSPLLRVRLEARNSNCGEGSGRRIRPDQDSEPTCGRRHLLRTRPRHLPHQHAHGPRVPPRGARRPILGKKCRKGVSAPSAGRPEPDVICVTFPFGRPVVPFEVSNGQKS
jgi:hypothetical protein